MAQRSGWRSSIFEYRLSYIDGRRALLIAQLRPTDIRGWIECYLLPLLELGEMDGCRYMGFISAVEQHAGILDQLSVHLQRRTDTFRMEIGALMNVPEPLRSHRIFQVVQTAVHAAVLRERSRAQGLEVLPFAIEVADLLDGLAGFLAAPVSEAARASIAGWSGTPGAWEFTV